MNSSSNHNASSPQPNRDSFSTAVAKNVILVALGLVFNYINGTLVHTFRKHQVFHLNPRYVLFIHLVLNDMIQLMTTITLFVSSYIFYRINASICLFILLLAMFTTLNTPLNLAVMAVECYVAVCFPLRHTQLWTVRRTYLLIGWIWAMSAVSVLTDVFLAVTTEPERLLYGTVYCAKSNVFTHPASLKNKQVSYLSCLVGVWLTLFYTYFRIFFAARAAKTNKPGGDSTKARNTILLHGFQLLLCMMTYVSHMIIKALVSWFPRYYKQVVFVSYILFQVLPRLISPIVYGLRDKTFKQYFKKHLWCRFREEHKP